jgi:hypothetical protein
MCLTLYFYGSRLIVAQVVLLLQSVLIHALMFPPLIGTFVYFLCIRVAPLCAFLMI